jgi:hypothetical protein
VEEWNVKGDKKWLGTKFSRGARTTGARLRRSMGVSCANNWINKSFAFLIHGSSLV